MPYQNFGGSTSVGKAKKQLMHWRTILYFTKYHIVRKTTRDSQSAMSSKTYFKKKLEENSN